MSVCQKPELLQQHLWSLCGVSGEMHNGVKKEVFGKDAARIWINDNIKMHNFTHPMVIIISL